MNDPRPLSNDRRPEIGDRRPEIADNRPPTGDQLNIHSTPRPTPYAIRHTPYAPAIELNIQELILHGFPPVDRYRIAEVVEHELTRLLSEGGLPASVDQERTIARLAGGLIQAASGLSVEKVGAQIAQAIYRGLSG